MKSLVIGLGVALGLIWGKPVIAQEFTLRVADSFPTTHQYSINTKAWLDRVTELTGGRITFEYYPAEQLAKSADLLDAVESGIADIGYAAPLYMSDRLPISTVTALPLVGNVSDPQKLNDAFNELAQNELNEVEFLPQGVRVVRAMVTAPYQLMMRADKITSLDQLKGKKIRSSGGVQERSVENLGAVPVAIPAPDLYPALQRGTIDGTLFNTPTAAGYKLEEQLKWSTSNLNLGLFPVLYVINENVWSTLPEDIQKAMIQAGRDVIPLAIEADRKREVEFDEALKARGGGMYAIEAEELPNWAAALKPVSEAWIKNLTGQGKPADKVFARWEKLVTE
ncbi:TRAP transporter substrate-binding protein DctP [Rhodoligotrophos ferricapiens]|uniref:TRAP transporter substrate-binding protein n=1 Tax=Rhodoligotrophos ferricapiens TaxID=3069264 RepID=UPI00315D6837